MSTKSKLLDEINKKAQRIKELKDKAKQKKTLEPMVFDFFREAESLLRIKHDPKELVDQSIDRTGYILVLGASQQLLEQIKINFDRDANLEVLFNADKTSVEGVQIYWSHFCRIANKCHDTLYIGVEQMLFS